MALRELLSVVEAAELLGLAEKTLNGWRSRGGGPPFAKLGGRILYRRRDLWQWVDARMRTHTESPRSRRRPQTAARSLSPP